MQGIALLREVPDSIVNCEISYATRQPIDVARARAQHADYARALASVGFEIRWIPPAPQHPDSVFVEDTAIVLDDVAVMTRPGASSRRGELDAVRQTLAGLREIVTIDWPATLDGGDVLVLDRDIIVGLSRRTNREGAAFLGRILTSRGYVVRMVAVTGCLHLKSAVTPIAGDKLLMNPQWVDRDTFRGWQLLETHPSEPAAANALWVGDKVIYAEEHKRTGELLRATGVSLLTIPADELAKAEGGVTCCSLIVR